MLDEIMNNTLLNSRKMFPIVCCVIVIITKTKHLCASCLFCLVFSYTQKVTIW